jgi:hypothetical protein
MYFSITCLFPLPLMVAIATICPELSSPKLFFYLRGLLKYLLLTYTLYNLYYLPTRILGQKSTQYMHMVLIKSNCTDFYCIPLFKALLLCLLLLSCSIETSGTLLLFVCDSNTLIYCDTIAISPDQYLPSLRYSISIHLLFSNSSKKLWNCGRDRRVC